MLAISFRACPHRCQTRTGVPPTGASAHALSPDSPNDPTKQWRNPPSPLPLCTYQSVYPPDRHSQSTYTVPSLTKGTQWSPKEPQSHHMVGKQDTEQQLGGQ